MKRLFKSKLRKNIEFYIEMINDSITSLEREITIKKIKQTLNPAEYSHYAIIINDLKHDINLLQELL